MEKQEKDQRKGKEAQQLTYEPLIWDCGSSLYDSFELKSFERQLHSAIHSRTLSMPHLSDRRPPPPPHPHDHPKKPPSSKISRSLQKLLRFVFKPKHQSRGSLFQEEEKSEDGFYAFGLYEHDKPPAIALSTILEAPELDGRSPRMRSPAGRTASGRVRATSFGITCA